MMPVEQAATHTAVQARSLATRRYVLALLVVVYTFNFIDRQILAILLPAIKAEFGVTDTILHAAAEPFQNLGAFPAALVVFGLLVLVAAWRLS